MKGTESRATTLYKRSLLRWYRHLMTMPPGRLLGEVLWARPTGRMPQGRSKSLWRVHLWLGNVSVFPQMSWKNWLDQGSLGFSAETDASTTRIEISSRMDGWSCWLESAKVNQTVRGLSKMVIRRRGVASSYLHCNPIISVH